MKLFNTFSRSLEEVQPIELNKIRLYTCGLTVYSQPHIGNWVAYTYWDVLVRTLRASGYEVTHVQNITDVGHLTSDEDAGEDKMLIGSLKEGLSAWQVADKYIEIADREAYELLRLSRPTHMPRATDYIQQQIAFVGELENKGFTYVIADGVYFDTSKISGYGRLARLDISGLRYGARVESTGKKNPTDFALWKLSPEGQKRDMEWDSPWGVGFPGWHLECSVLAREFLGDQIDIHTGGIDHIPVHHTNEIAQTETLTGKKFSNLWIHANHLKVSGTKISKSLGNVYNLNDIREKGFGLQAFKLMLLGKHYRTEGNFTWEILQAAQNRLNKWGAFADLQFQLNPDANLLGELYFTNIHNEILGFLQSDLNTPGALVVIDKMIEHVEQYGKGLNSKHLNNFNQLLVQIDTLLGIDMAQCKDITPEQKVLLASRRQARDSKDWQTADRLRDELKQQGIEINDAEHGQIWSRTTAKS